MYFALKCLVSGLLVGLISLAADKSPKFGAIVASLPLTSILALIWLHREGKPISELIDLSNGIAVIVLPSLIFFIALSYLLKKGTGFYLAMLLSAAALVAVYFVYIKVVEKIS